MSSYKIASDDLEGDASASEHTMASRQNARLDEKEQSKVDGGENGDDGQQQPVGFWDKGLGKTRLKVFGLWARTSKSITLPVLVDSITLMT